MKDKPLKERIEEILTEFGATSPTRNWDLELSPNKEQIRKEVIEHRKSFIEAILTEIKAGIPKEKTDDSKDYGHTNWIYNQAITDLKKAMEGECLQK